MTTGSRTIVKHAPAKMSHPTAYRFFHDLQPLLMANRSNLVLDFSQVGEIDSAGVGVLLRCLEEVMKGNLVRERHGNPTQDHAAEIGRQRQRRHLLYATRAY